MQSISPIELRAVEQAAAIDIIDVRSPAEFAAEHIAGSINLPLDEIDRRALPHRTEDAQLVIVCRTGKRATKAMEALAAREVRSMKCLAGGIEAWRAAGFPTRRTGRGVISVERQVRIAAGMLVVIGAALSLIAPIAGAALAGGVGAGLVFAGVTDSCAMGLMLARMPWNKRTPALARA